MIKIIAPLFLIMAFITANFVATEQLAAKFNFHPALGKPMFLNYYEPFDWIFWAMRYYDSYPQFMDAYFTKQFIIYTLIFLVTFFIKIFVNARSEKSNIDKDLHGSAHWQTHKEMKSSGILDETDGVYIGGYEDKDGAIRPLLHNGPEHIIAFAPTRSGKGVGLVVPTLLQWKGSAIILDIKGENFALTSGFRQKHLNNVVIKFDPADDTNTTARYNPLEEVRVGTPKENGDAEKIALTIVDAEGKGVGADYWQNCAKGLIAQLILYAIYKANKEGENRPSLADVSSVLNNPDKDIREVLEEMLEFGKAGDTPTHKEIAKEARKNLNKADNELSGVIGTSSAFLNLFADPLIASNTARSDFKIIDIVNQDRPTSLYLILRPSEKERLRPLIRILLNQIHDILLEDMKFKDGKTVQNFKHRLLLMFDEFTSLGKLDIIEKSIAYIAGYGIKAYLIIQDLSQLQSVYGRDESIISNCHIIPSP